MASFNFRASFPKCGCSGHHRGGSGRSTFRSSLMRPGRWVNTSTRSARKSDSPMECLPSPPSLARLQMRESSTHMRSRVRHPANQKAHQAGAGRDHGQARVHRTRCAIPPRGRAAGLSNPCNPPDRSILARAWATSGTIPCNSKGRGNVPIAVRRDEIGIAETT